MPKILISYRRSDTAGVTGRIFDRLVANYGKESVFMDVDNIPFGIDFRQHIRTALLEGDVLLVVMGNAWLGRSDNGPSRIQDETDPVRVEVEAALQGGIPMIPILVDDARMPGVGDLPESLREFAFRNAAKVDQGRDFGYHVDRVIRSVDGILRAKADAAEIAAAAAAPPPMTEAAPPIAAEPPAPEPTPVPEPEVAPRPAALEPTLVPQPEPARSSAVPPVPLVVSPAVVTSVPPVAPTASEPEAAPSRFPWIRNPQDFFGGLALIGLGLFALWASGDLPGMKGFAFGPGTAPRMFAVLLAAMGTLISVNGLIFVGPAIERFAWRGPLFVLASVITFATTVRPLGLMISSFATIIISAAAADDVRWRETFLVAVALTLFCAVLFTCPCNVPLFNRSFPGLNLPMPLWPQFWR